MDEAPHSKDQLFRVLFKVTVDEDSSQPMDIKKFLGAEATADSTKMGEGLMQRLMVMVKYWEIEGTKKEEISTTATKKKMDKAGGNLSKVPELFKMLHVFRGRQLDSVNDPNAATNLKDFSSSSAQ